MLLPPNVQPVFTHSHYTSGIKTKRTLQRGLWCLIILSTSDLYWSLVRALIGVLTPNMPDTGDQKKETTFFPCFCFVFVFLMREGDVLHRKSLWVLSIRYDLPLERAFGPFWMNAEPVALVLLYVPVRKMKGWMWVYLKASNWTKFFLCVNSTQWLWGAQSFSNTSSLLSVQNWRENPVYMLFFVIPKTNLVHIVACKWLFH